MVICLRYLACKRDFNSDFTKVHTQVNKISRASNGKRKERRGDILSSDMQSCRYMNK